MSATLSSLDRFAQQAEQLYSLPAVALEVLRLAGQPQVDPRQLKLCLESDPALAARILKVVNSSLFGLSRQVSDLQQALALLGLKPLKALLLGFSLPPELLRGIHAEALQHYWQHTLLKAVACRLLEQFVAKSDEEEAFIAGLLQDVGILALLQQLGENYATMYVQTRLCGGDLQAVEIPTLGFDHLSLSARMLMNWRLPPKLCQAVAVPPRERAVEHAPTPSRQLCQILHLGELLTRYVEQPHDAELAQLLEIGERYFELGPVRLHSVLTELGPHFESLAGVLAIELPSGPSSQELLQAAHRRLASITAEMVPELIQMQRAADEATALESVLQTTRDLQHLANHAARPVGEFKLGDHKSERRADGGSDFLHPSNSSPLRRTTPVASLAAAGQPARTAADPGLLGRLTSVLQTCRQNRSPLSLAILQLDHFADAQFVCGIEPTMVFLERFRRHLAEATGVLGPCLQLTSTRFALLWGDCSRSDALATLRNVHDQLPDWQDESLPPDAPRLSMSAGLATVSLPSRNFPPNDLVAAAQRCLDGALHSGGNTIKSIEL
ncbi:HDOD domain protein [Anatilimnocola aggregata]|uniref:HDOD domain protein n=1 Tax=Anatilimnocola aggregata TaxID=2528021 RepID=A0A517YE43_9BACT|nr:HDOD domain-containing protein [Anatilimnocola aggregata]QDU28499.1 HDOD domain protein [Anatilimnocola aggregata]